MTPTQLKLYELLGNKTLSFGCLCKDMCGRMYMIHNPAQFFVGKDEIIGHEPTIADLHRWLSENDIQFIQNDGKIVMMDVDCNFPYNSSLTLIDQSEETLLAIINLIENYGK